MTVDLLPSQMTKPQLRAYLTAAGAYKGHSRASVDELRAIALELRYGQVTPDPTFAPGESETPETCKLADSAPGSDGRLATTCNTVVNPAGFCCGCGTQLAEPGGTEALALADDPIRRVSLAKVEHRLLRQWIKDGERPPRPLTPNLDAVEADYAARDQRPRSTKRTPKAKATPAPRPQAEGIVYSRNGRPMAPSENKLSTVAYYYTKGVTDAPRISTAALLALLAEAGITEPTTTSWTYTLPNGIVLAATIADKAASAAA